MSELVAHQFDDLEQQTEAGTLGMWTFLATEVLFFGGMICGYAIYRHLYFPAWHQGSLIVDNFRLARHQQRRMEYSRAAHQQPHRGAGRARGQARRQPHAFCRCSPRRCCSASHFSQSRPRNTPTNIAKASMPCYGVFHPDNEISADLRRAATESHTDEIALRHEFQLFWVFYFFMTGVHALHMVIGIGLFTYLLIEARRGRFTPQKQRPSRSWDSTGTSWIWSGFSCFPFFIWCAEMRSDEHKIDGLGIYLLIYVLLMALLVATVVAGSVDLGAGMSSSPWSSRRSRPCW